MPRDFRRYDPDQTLLLPPSLRDWLPDDHLALFLSDAVEANLGEAPEATLADAGYASERNLAMLEKRRIDGYIAVGREKTIGDGKPPAPTRRWDA